MNAYKKNKQNEDKLKLKKYRFGLFMCRICDRAQPNRRNVNLFIQFLPFNAAVSSLFIFFALNQ